MRTRHHHTRKRSMRIRFTNRGKCLLCYLFAFSLPLLWQYWGLSWIYPYKLAATAPQLPFSLIAPQDSSYRSVLAAQEANWLGLIAACALAVWAISALLQLLWRFTHRKALHAFRATQRAVRSYRLLMLLVWALCLLTGAALWKWGVSLIPGRTLWDYLMYFGFYLLLPLCIMTVSRLAAPSVISGRHAFFKRL